MSASESSPSPYAASTLLAVPTDLAGPSHPSIVVDDATLAHDRGIRSHLRWRLEHATASHSETIVVDELPVCSGIARVDLAVLNGSLHGFEIKSERDSLTRLFAQAEYFSEVMDHVTLVVVDQFKDHAAEIVPPWWTISIVLRRGSAVFFETVREGQRNPAISVLSFLEFLWRDEAYQIAVEAGVSSGLKSANKLKIYSRLAELIPWDLLHSVVLQKLRFRLSSGPSSQRT